MLSKEGWLNNYFCAQIPKRISMVGVLRMWRYASKKISKINGKHASLKEWNHIIGVIIKNQIYRTSIRRASIDDSYSLGDS